jgi:glycosyltransferase involved in cell wall biosynthesis
MVYAETNRITEYPIRQLIKVAHIITDLSLGGAETMLYRVLSHMDALHFEHEVISLTTLGEITGPIRELKVPVRALQMKRGIPDPFATVRLAQWIRASKPQVVQTWMYHANLLGGLAARFSGDVPLVWGIHHTDLDSRRNKRLTIWTAKTCGAISGWLPRCAIFCSESALQSHRRIGYDAKEMVVIPNGFDLEEFKPDPTARSAVISELRLHPGVTLIGMAARFHPIKDHRNFTLAAARLEARFPDVHFVLFGRDVTPENTELGRLILAAGIQSRCHLLGERRDVARLFSAMNIVVSSSLSEAFPLAVGEAMSCGTPCVVTNVGDSAQVVGTAGKVVPPGNPDALAEALAELVAQGPEARRQLGMAARCRVQAHFALRGVVQKYESIYSRLAKESQKDAARFPCRGVREINPGITETSQQQEDQSCSS